MPQQENYQNEIARLNNEIAVLKEELLKQQMDQSNYRQSIQQAQMATSNNPLPKDINPILKQIRNKNLSMREKRELVMPNLYPSLPEDIYYQWVAPSRLTIKRDRQWYWTMGLILMILIAIALIFKERIVVAVILAFGFALYVQASLPATDTVYKLTKAGVEIGEGEATELYSWGQIMEYSYYFKNGTEVLYLDTILSTPQRLIILFNQEDRKHISMVLESQLPYKPVPKKQGWLSRYSEGIYIPIQDFKALQEKIDQYYDAKYAEIIHQLQQEGRLEKNVTVEDVRNAESIQTLKLLEEIEKQQAEEAKRILGL